MQIGPIISWEFHVRDNGVFLTKRLRTNYFIAFLLEEVKSETSSLNAVLISKATARNQKTSKKLSCLRKLLLNLMAHNKNCHAHNIFSGKN